MRWRKLGQLLDPTGAARWMQTHAALPIARHLEGDRFVVYCSGRDAEGRAQIGAVEVALGDSPRVLRVASEPLVRFGSVGTYDDRGILTSALVPDGDRLVMYTTGVMLGVTVPFYYAIGAATSGDGGATWDKCGIAPLLDRTPGEPYLLIASPYVLRDEGRWRMWYMSAARWELENDAPKHYYRICYAESPDGFTWQRPGTIAIDFVENEYAISRPSVVRDPDCYRMWYACRGAAYRIGYAESHDGISWIRKDAE
ncbi:MAG: hypothetical protein JO199_09275, partial [Candidatus Eremiobacteraeota bacterium]|nr:hypothetical protein [Candidatus Eremiobacteraeota bacterium]